MWEAAESPIQRCRSANWNPCGERACPALGCEAPPMKDECGVPDIAQWLVLGLLRTPTRDKPARHKSASPSAERWVGLVIGS